jgi:tripartite-type tricarboxylate transporter receptor subunit TctC
LIPPRGWWRASSPSWWGKPVVIENRAGAAMIIGTEAAAKAAPDGYTLLVAHDSTMAMNPVVYPNLGYHSQRDFEPVALLTSIPEVVLVNEGVPAKSIQELVALAKANPGKLNHASAVPRPCWRSNCSRPWPASTSPAFRFAAARRR